MLGNGFYNQHASDVWFFEKSPWRGEPTLLFQLRLDYVDGTSEIIASDSTWRASTGPVVHDGIRNGEQYDARREMPGWDTAAFDDSTWAEPKSLPGPRGAPGRDDAAHPRHANHHPVAIAEPQPGVFVFDMGQNFAGWAQLKVSGPAGTKITCATASGVQPDGSLDQ